MTTDLVRMGVVLFCLMHSYLLVSAVISVGKIKSAKVSIRRIKLKAYNLVPGAAGVLCGRPCPAHPRLPFQDQQRSVASTGPPSHLDPPSRRGVGWRDRARPGDQDHLPRDPD